MSRSKLGQFTSSPRPERRTGKVVACANCGKEKYFVRSRVKRTKKLFCCRKCRNEYASKTAKNVRESVCDVCGKKFKSVLCSGYRTRSCSAKCRAKRERDGRHEMTCKHCGVVFLITSSEKRSGKGVFCSRDCYISFKSTDKKEDDEKYIGTKYGEWTVMSVSDKRMGSRYVECRCSCGTVQHKQLSGLKAGLYNRCKMHNSMKMVGKKYGRLTVVGVESGAGRISWANCLCECGNTHRVRTNCLQTGTTMSCGCIASEISKINISKMNVRVAPEGVEWCKWQRDTLGDSYVRHVLTRNTSLLKQKDIPQSLVEAKRVQLKVQRLVKGIKNGKH